MTMCHKITVAGPLSALLLLAGCSALLGGGKPEQLYRFGMSVAPKAVAGSIIAPRFTLLMMPVRFAAEIEADRVLASRNQQTLYVKGLRWVAPAPVLFGQSVQATFRSRAPWIAVTNRRARGPSDHVLQITVDRFEVRYDEDAKTLPKVLVEGEATLLDAGKHSLISSYRIVAEQQAGGGNATAIVDAFDKAAAAAIVATVDWTSLAISAHRPPGPLSGF